MEAVTCDLCGEDNYQPILSGRDLYNNLPGNFTVVKCNNCGFVFTNPRPSQQELAQYYPDSAGYFNPELETAPIENLDSLSKRNREIAGVPNFVPDGKLLDVGCSYGLFLRQMANLGWTVLGIEQNRKAAEFGRARHGVTIINDTFENTRLEEKFDAITLRMVLEHMPSPSRVLEKVNRCLEENGQLIVIVPDFSGLEFRLYRQYCYALQLPTHLNHFTPDSLRRICEEHGFRLEKIVHHKFDRDFVASAQYLKSKGLIYKWLAGILQCRWIRQTIVKTIMYLLSRLGMTSRMTVYFRKCNKE